jgi:hypothetical protein
LFFIFLQKRFEGELNRARYLLSFGFFSELVEFVSFKVWYEKMGTSHSVKCLSFNIKKQKLKSLFAKFTLNEIGIEIFRFILIL